MTDRVVNHIVHYVIDIYSSSAIALFISYVGASTHCACVTFKVQSCAQRAVSQCDEMREPCLNLRHASSLFCYGPSTL